MKKYLFPIVLVSALLAVFSCNKSFDAQEEGLVASSESKIFTATIESDDNTDGTKTTLDGMKVKWVEGDEISINGIIYVATPNDNDPTKATFTKKVTEPEQSNPQKDKDGNYTAYYPASLYNATTQETILPSTQEHGSFKLNPMYASSTSTSLSFKNICSVLRITSTEFLSEGSTISLSANQPLNGQFTVDNTNTAVINTNSTLSDKNYSITLTKCVGTGPFYIAIPAQNYTTFEIQDKSGQTIKSMFKTFSTAKKLERKNIYSLSYTGASPGIFTVEKGKTVRFSPGNLYCKRPSSESTSWSWHFYDAQYKCNSLNGSNTSRTATNNDTEIDLFTWGCGNWSTDPTTTKNLDGSNNLSDNTDWGSKMGSGWFTLSDAEWKYLLGFSTDKRGGSSPSYNYFAKANVNGVKGLLIFPDGYTVTTPQTGIATVNDIYAELPTDKIPSDTWITMEAAGCVFLPAAGYRNGSRVDNVGSNGYYWSSNGTNFAYYLYFVSGNAFVDYSNPSIGFSVRLVRESN